MFYIPAKENEKEKDPEKNECVYFTVNYVLFFKNVCIKEKFCKQLYATVNANLHT